MAKNMLYAVTVTLTFDYQSSFLNPSDNCAKFDQDVTAVPF